MLYLSREALNADIIELLEELRVIEFLEQFTPTLALPNIPAGAEPCRQIVD